MEQRFETPWNLTGWCEQCGKLTGGWKGMWLCDRCWNTLQGEAESAEPHERPRYPSLPRIPRMDGGTRRDERQKRSDGAARQAERPRAHGNGPTEAQKAVPRALCPYPKGRGSEVGGAVSAPSEAVVVTSQDVSTWRERMIKINVLRGVQAYRPFRWFSLPPPHLRARLCLLCLGGFLAGFSVCLLVYGVR